MRAATSARRRETDADSSSLRPGASPSQNGIVGAAPCASSTRTQAALHAQDAIGGVAELEHVARQALHGEVLVHRADRPGSRARAAPGSRRCREWRRPRSGRSGARRAGRAARRSRHRSDSAAPRRPRRRGEAFREHAHHLVELARVPARDRATPGAAAKSSCSFQSRAATSATICCASTSRGCSGMTSRSSSPRLHAVDKRRALDEIVAREREQPALGRAVRPRGPSGRRAAGSWRWNAASRAGTRGRPRRCRCRARATRSRPGP